MPLKEPARSHKEFVKTRKESELRPRTMAATDAGMRVLRQAEAAAPKSTFLEFPVNRLLYGVMFSEFGCGLSLHGKTPGRSRT